MMLHTDKYYNQNNENIAPWYLFEIPCIQGTHKHQMRLHISYNEYLAIKIISYMFTIVIKWIVMLAFCIVPHSMHWTLHLSASN